ncbi:malto-oligosyltrehalose trehalohydrolase [Paludisphaera sp.]|uniref:malto-oligosyltrehalose trehalohydrolase n=1 Tax=Paludisphaera sp. TaxID=2017432 RepID=UPI00301BB324
MSQRAPSRVEQGGKAEGGRVEGRRLPVGADVLPDGGVSFRVWAPNRRAVAVLVQEGPTWDAGSEPAVVPMSPEPGGYFSCVAPDARAGSLYRYRLDDESDFPDPASRFQPEGPHGPSQVVDPGEFEWTDAGWKGLELRGQVLYEMHIGTLTPEGTWDAAIRELPALKELGITAVEVMPVAEFPGRFGWGYDGVDLYAPYHVYGDPDDFRRFVDEAHRLGLGVILDVVYNHLGPDGAYHKQFAEEYYHSTLEKTDWGASLNFDEEGSAAVREYFVSNAGYWVDEFHLDGLRLDATQAILDHSEDHVLAELARHARARAAGRSVLLIAEDETQDSIRVRPPERGGYGLDAQWNDDYHHAAIVALSGRGEGYYADFQGTPQELISATKWGFLFQGQFFGWTGKPRGNPALGVPSPSFVTFLENHDQVSNSPRGERLGVLASASQYRAMAAAWLLAPHTPMFFQGQEYGATTRFLFFADHGEELSRLVKQGREEFHGLFQSAGRPELREHLADPADPATFEACKLDPAERARRPELLEFHRDLLALRREDPTFSAQRGDLIHGAVIGPEAFVLRYLDPEGGPEDRLVIVNLGRDLAPAPTSEPLMAPPRGRRWDVAWYSEHPRYGGGGTPPFEDNAPWRVPARATLVFRAIPRSAD